MTFTKILCPIDFSPTSRHALHMAIEIAKSTEAELVIAHAWHMPALYYSELAFPSHVDQEIVESSEAELAAAMRGARSAGVERVSTLLLRGIPADAILEAIETDRGFDLVVIGANGRSGLARILMGSVAEKVVRRAPCSVMAVHATHSLGAFRNILCPIDFSEASLGAVELAQSLVVPGGRGVTLLHVLDVPANYASSPAMSDVISELDKDSSERLDRLIATSPRTTHMSRTTRIGSPGRQILTLLESEPAFDLVVMGTHGRKGLERAFLGSVAEKTVRHAPCPVLIARRRVTSPGL